MKRALLWRSTNILYQWPSRVMFPLIFQLSPTHNYMSKNVGRFPVAIMATPVVLDGKVIGTIEAFRDITREKEIDRAKSEVVSLASHQLRTPLTAISWYTEMILKGDVGTVIP